MKKVSEDLVRVVVDYRDSMGRADTGGFARMYRGTDYTKLVRSCGLNLICEGKKVKLP